MKTVIYYLSLCLMLLACNANKTQIDPTINLVEFSGFSIPEKLSYEKTKLDGYEYQTTKESVIRFESCTTAEKSNEADIAEYELYRYRLLLNACSALKKYTTVKSSTLSYFPTKLETQLIAQFPATSIPLLSQSQQDSLENFKISEHFSKAKLSIEPNGSIKLLTTEDEIYYSELARGDFTDDGIEDLLIRAEWFALNARGKHADLLVLSKSGADKPITVSWRQLKMDK